MHFNNVTQHALSHSGDAGAKDAVRFQGQGETANTQPSFRRSSGRITPVHVQEVKRLESVIEKLHDQTQTHFRTLDLARNEEVAKAAALSQENVRTASFFFFKKHRLLQRIVQDCLALLVYDSNILLHNCTLLIHRWGGAGGLAGAPT